MSDGGMGLHCHGIDCCWECHHGRPSHPVDADDGGCVQRGCYRVSIVVPWRPDGCHRDAAWSYLRRLWEQRYTGWQILEGRPPDGGWCKAAAVAAAVERAAGEVLVVADADVWCEGVQAAVDAVTAGAPWAVPHWHVHRLTETATAAVLAGGRLDGELGGSRWRRLERQPYPGFAGGGLVVLPRVLYREVPLDPRFVGWGQEDECWALALTTIAGVPWRGEAPLWHLWHPPQPRTSSRWGSPASQALCRRYQAARTPAAMRRLLGEMPGYGA
ncbi:hypothetical protein [Actinomadura miaoliensis]|uniref:Glycosyltransferase n=1 Tax=Actinomadura miaoliensis TaxID=430685 RepID=A0ABP7W760_9ACTN